MAESLKLTKTRIDDLQARDGDYFVWDAEQQGFGVKVTPKGRKVFVQRYTVPGHTEKRATLGSFGAHRTLQQARKEGLRILVAANDGVDHNAEKKRSRQQRVELAFADYAEFFIEDFLRDHWQGSFAQSASLLRSRAIPYFRKQSLADISRKDATLWADTMKENPPTQRRAVEVVGRLFNWAIARGDIEHNPMIGVERKKPNPARERVLDEHEMALLWRTCETWDHPYSHLVQMLLLTGQRRGEVGGMAWEELELEAQLWTVPKTRTKSGKGNAVPLTPLAVELIQALPCHGSLVFTVSGDKPLGNHSKLKVRLDAKIAKLNGGEQLPHWTLHDLRRTVATRLQMLDVEQHIVEYCQSRVPLSGAAARYQRHLYADKRRAAMRLWDAELGRITSRSI